MTRVSIESLQAIDYSLRYFTHPANLVRFSIDEIRTLVSSWVHQMNKDELISRIVGQHKKQEGIELIPLEKSTKKKLSEFCAEEIVMKCRRNELVQFLGSFPLERLIHWLYNSTDLLKLKALKLLLDEPLSEKEMRDPVRNFIESEWSLEPKYGGKWDYEVPLPLPGGKRFIDVCCAKLRDNKPFIVAAELKIEVSQKAVDQAFVQALDNSKGADLSYVAFSPLVYIAYHEAIEEKIEDFPQVECIICNTRGRLMGLSEANPVSPKPEVYNEVAAYMNVEPLKS